MTQTEQKAKVSVQQTAGPGDAEACTSGGSKAPPDGKSELQDRVGGRAVPTWLTPHASTREISHKNTILLLSENSQEDDSIKRKGDRTEVCESFELDDKDMD